MLKAIETYLNLKFRERQEIIHGMLVALVARQNLLMVGPPGTAKSALVVELAGCIEGSRYFQWLLTRYTTPEEIFGPYSLAALERDTYQRNTAGKLPEAEIAFLDEIYKASSAILNTLLTLINERVFFNDGQRISVPLISVFGASNEYPEEDENLAALHDRFLLRYETDRIAEEDNFMAVLAGALGRGDTPERPVVKLGKLYELQQKAVRAAVPEDVLRHLADIRRDLAERKIYSSDRRFVLGLSVLKAEVVLQGREVVEPCDLGILKHVLWERPDQRATVASIVAKYAVDPTADLIAHTRSAVDRIWGDALRVASVGEIAEKHNAARSRWQELLGDLERVKIDFPSKAPVVDALTGDIQQKMGALPAAQIAVVSQALMREAEQVDAQVERLDDSMDSDLLTDAGLKAHSKLKGVEKELKKLIAEFGEDYPEEYVQQPRDKIAECREKVNKKCLGIE